MPTAIVPQPKKRYTEFTRPSSRSGISDWRSDTVMTFQVTMKIAVRPMRDGPQPGRTRMSRRASAPGADLAPHDAHRHHVPGGHRRRTRVHEGAPRTAPTRPVRMSSPSAGRRTRPPPGEQHEHGGGDRAGAVQHAERDREGSQQPMTQSQRMPSAISVAARPGTVGRAAPERAGDREDHGGRDGEAAAADEERQGDADPDQQSGQRWADELVGGGLGRGPRCPRSGVAAPPGNGG